ncbi:hypothetical protein DPMN_094818 [Dreissena polymorpha]|uniref:Uncharacterized protein n=1 Tax=Dreissena polymorpha TaxID=45954 RepID=A0A9D4R301_DREPO|nr:hypothetical protein DPMN_094818 [Dreissena polymorpha]
MLTRAFFCGCGYADVVTDGDEWNKHSAFQLVLFFCGYADADADTDRWNSSLKQNVLSLISMCGKSRLISDDT